MIMTKRKGVISKVFVVLVVLTLLSCCFLGSTFARYTSGGSGTATMQVAKWDVNQTEADMDVTFNTLSPSMKVWQSGQTRTHTSAVVKIAAITNNGEVNADVTFAVDDTVTVALDPSTTWGWGTSFACDPTTGAVTGAPSQDEVAGLFSITLYATETANNYTALKGDKVTSDEDKTTLAPGQSIYLWATVTWTSDDDLNLNSTATGVEPDALDTWVGENVESVAWTVSFKAVQSSMLPK